MKAETSSLRTERQVLAQVLDAFRSFGIDIKRQNTGAAVNPSGRLVCFGEKGDSDLAGTLPDGRTIHVEVKRENFDPSKLRGSKREHFERQLERLRRTNATGGVAFWTDDAKELAEVILPEIIAGASVEEPGYGRLRINRKP
jgi:hypothetical protein